MQKLRAKPQITNMIAKQITLNLNKSLITMSRPNYGHISLKTYGTQIAVLLTSTKTSAPSRAKQQA